MIVKTLEKPAWHTPAICSFFLLGFFPLLPCLSSPVGLVGLLFSSPSGPHPLQVSSAQKAAGECVCSWQSRRKTLHLQLKKYFRSEKCWLTLLGELKSHSQAHVPFGSVIAATSRYQGTCFCFISAPACFISRASHMTPLNFNFHMCKMWINSTYSIIWNLEATIYCINIKHYDYYYRTLYECSVSYFSKWHLLHPFKNRLEKINPRIEFLIVKFLVLQHEDNLATWEWGELLDFLKGYNLDSWVFCLCLRLSLNHTPGGSLQACGRLRNLF